MNVFQTSAVPIRLRTNIALCRFSPAPLSTIHLLLLIFPLQHGVSQASQGWHRNVNVSSSETSCLPVTCLVNLTACVMTSVCLGLLKPLRRSVTNSETAEEGGVIQDHVIQDKIYSDYSPSVCKLTSGYK